MTQEALARANDLTAILQTARTNVDKIKHILEALKNNEKREHPDPDKTGTLLVSYWRRQSLSYLNDMTELHSEGMPFTLTEFLSFYLIKLQARIDAWQEELENL